MAGRLLVSLLALFLLAACGGSGGSGPVPPPADGGGDGDGSGGPGGGGDGDGSGGDGDGDGDGGGPDGPPTSYAARSEAFWTLSDDMDSVTGGAITPGPDLPVTGQAVYTGWFEATIGGGPVASEDYNGDVILVSSFEDGTLGGRITNMRRADETPLTGTLEIREGRIASDGPAQITGRVDGTLTGGIGGLDVSATLTGDFYGAGASHAAASLDGTVGTRLGATALSGSLIGRR